MPSQNANPRLRRLHSDRTIELSNHSSFVYWSSRSTSEIIDSLASGSHEPLIVKRDGTVMQGNTRVMILERRGFDVESLQRVPYP